MKIYYLIGILVVISILIGFFVFYTSKNRSGPIIFDKKFSDEELLQYTQSSFNKEKMMFKNIIIGTHNDIPVRASFPCSDQCPDYTIRIIRYDVELSQCNEIGGEVKSINVPQSIAMVREEFCFPKVIVNNNIYKFVEK